MDWRLRSVVKEEESNELMASRARCFLFKGRQTYISIESNANLKWMMMHSLKSLLTALDSPNIVKIQSNSSDSGIMSVSRGKMNKKLSK